MEFILDDAEKLLGVISLWVIINAGGKHIVYRVDRQLFPDLRFRVWHIPGGDKLAVLAARVLLHIYAPAGGHAEQPHIALGFYFGGARVDVPGGIWHGADPKPGSAGGAARC